MFEGHKLIVNCSHCVVICLSITQSVSSADTGEEGEELNTEVQSVDKQSLFTTVFDTLGKCNSNGCTHDYIHSRCYKTNLDM